MCRSDLRQCRFPVSFVARLPDLLSRVDGEASRRPTTSENRASTYAGTGLEGRRASPHAAEKNASNQHRTEARKIPENAKCLDQRPSLLDDANVIPVWREFEKSGWRLSRWHQDPSADLRIHERRRRF